MKKTTWFRLMRLTAVGSAMAAIAAMVVVAAMLVANGVDTTVSPEDRAVISSLQLDDYCSGTDGFDEQLQCVRRLQQTVFERYPDTSDSFVRGESAHRPADVDRRGYGSCYDRATLIEQTLRHYGFEVRRVAVYERQSLLLNYLRPGINSHALSEVKTDRGWMAVESIDPLVGVDAEGTPYTIGDIREGVVDGQIDDATFGAAIPDNFFDGKFVYVYGVHSRHGYFFEPHLPVPEVHWSKFSFSSAP